MVILSRAALAALLVGLLSGAARAQQISAFDVGSGLAPTTFATGFPTTSAQPYIGPTGLAFDSSDTLFAMDYANGTLYRFGPGGGAASAASQVNTRPISGTPDGLAFGTDGRLYATRQRAGDVVEINPATGAIVRTVATGIPSATGLAADPYSGDLFVSQGCRSGDILRIANFAHGPGAVSTYSSPGGTDGITLGPDGTLYAALSCTGTAARIAGTNASTPGAVTPISVSIPAIDGIAVAAGSDPSRPPFLLANANNGTITRADLTTSPPTLTAIVVGGSRGDFIAVGPDGCVYATQSTGILKVTNADGSCSEAPTSAVARLDLAPAAVLPSPLVGTAQTFVATLANVDNPGGTPVTVTVTGANPRMAVAMADMSGQATFAHAGAQPGTDTVVATAKIGKVAVTSNPARVTWVARASPTPIPATAMSTPAATPIAGSRILPAATPPAGSSRCRLPLAVHVSASADGGHHLLVRVHTAPHAQLRITMRMAVNRAAISGTESHHGPHVDTVTVVVREALPPATADGQGWFTGILRIADMPVTSVQLQTTATASTACGTVTRTVRLVIPVTLRPPLPLTVGVMPRIVAAGEQLAVTVRTLARARVRIALQVLTHQVVVTGKGNHRRHVVRSTVVYQVVRQGSAGAHGRFAAIVPVGYKPVARMAGLLTVSVRAGHDTATLTTTITVLPAGHRR